MQADILGPDMNEYMQAQQLLVAAAHHDTETLRTLLKTVPATVRDESTGYTALHTAIAAFAPEKANSDASETGGPQTDSSATRPGAERSEQVQEAEKTIQLLFQNGAIWNDLDANNETPGCLADRLDLTSLYEMVVDAGVRAELLLNRLDDFEMLDDGDDDDEANAEEDGREEGLEEAQGEAAEIANAIDVAATAQQHDAAGPADGNVQAETPAITINPSEDTDNTIENTIYLSSALSFAGDRILDASTNGVMMSWETSLMHRSASLILPTPGLSILNIGFGMGIFDRYVQEQCGPCAHHIVEAHPDVLRRIRETGWNPNAEAYSKKNVTLHAGTWQDVLPKLVEENITFNAIYFDTFAEDYKAFKEFFSEYVIALLKPEGRWSFFHGLGADRRVCYGRFDVLISVIVGGCGGHC